MTVLPMRALPFLAVLFAPSLVLAVPKAGDSGPPVAKTLGACGAKILPLVAGNTWTYKSVESNIKIDEKLQKLSPHALKMIVITVKSVDTDPKTKETVVKLEEKLTAMIQTPSKEGKSQPPKADERTVESTIECNAKKFEISPDSFFFSGEPGGFVNLTFDKVDRPRGGSWQLTNGAIGEAEWREDVVAHWIRKGTEGTGVKETSGKLELERKFSPEPADMIVTKAGQWPKADKLAITTTGRITLDQAHPIDKPMELPAGWINTLWFGQGVGVLQTLNSYGHQYQLVEYSVK
jgi:hypothetical protein